MTVLFVLQTWDAAELRGTRCLRDVSELSSSSLALAAVGAGRLLSAGPPLISCFFVFVHSVVFLRGGKSRGGGVFRVEKQQRVRPTF